MIWYKREPRLLEIPGPYEGFPGNISMALYRGAMPSPSCLNITGGLWCSKADEHKLENALRGWSLDLYRVLGPSPSDMIRRVRRKILDAEGSGFRSSCSLKEICIGWEASECSLSGSASRSSSREKVKPCWDGRLDVERELFHLLQHWYEERWVLFL